MPFLMRHVQIQAKQLAILALVSVATLTASLARLSIVRCHSFDIRHRNATLACVTPENRTTKKNEKRHTYATTRTQQVGRLPPGGSFPKLNNTFG